MIDYKCDYCKTIRNLAHWHVMRGECPDIITMCQECAAEIGATETATEAEIRAFHSPRPGLALNTIPSAQTMRGVAAHFPGILHAYGRTSKHSLTGHVMIIQFDSRAKSLAKFFAQAWAKKLPAICKGCVIRKSPAGGLLEISIPINL